jgi:poly(A) polymerase/tRNA nucleotidyltransferase (CCA-adding enzyme)
MSVLTREAIPGHVAGVLDTLVLHGHQAYLVGGACRDLLMDTEPKDWDVATSASPVDILKAFPHHPSLEVGALFGTIVLMTQGGPVEVTTFRSEASYTDSRHPDSVSFHGDIHMDLARRDFTVNAMAWRWPGGPMLDPFRGKRDLKRQAVRAVGDPQERIAEDPLRMLRALRFIARGWRLDRATQRAMECHSGLLSKVSRERVRDEFSHILLGSHVARATWLMCDLGLMAHVIPELLEGRSVEGIRGPFDNVTEHSIAILHYLRPDLGLRLAGLLHDVAKPRTWRREDGKSHFHGHDSEGASMAREILRRLRFDNATQERVVLLVREHMFQAGPSISDAGLRRLVGRVGRGNVLDLFELRQADILASGGIPGPAFRGSLARAKAILQGHHAVDTRDLAVDGHDVMEVLGIPEGPRVGRFLRALLETVLEDPSTNEREYLLGLLGEMARRKET